MDHEPPNEATISHLSSLLLENGHISSPLTLHSLFPSLNSNSTSNNSINSREIYQIQTKTLNQLTKCLYSLISSKSKSTNIIQELLTSIRVNEYELERNKNKTKIQFDKIKLIENEKEELKAKLINMSKELDNEKDKCKIAREESIKARSALQSLKTQFNVSTNFVCFDLFFCRFSRWVTICSSYSGLTDLFSYLFSMILNEGKQKCKPLKLNSND